MPRAPTPCTEQTQTPLVPASCTLRSSCTLNTCLAGRWATYIEGHKLHMEVVGPIQLKQISCSRQCEVLATANHNRQCLGKIDQWPHSTGCRLTYPSDKGSNFRTGTEPSGRVHILYADSLSISSLDRATFLPETLQYPTSTTKC